ncbi:MAG: 4-hydroxy-tetrahydrodipicolinate synthase [Gammaproteobacteria bacterium]|nr:4-hydroxy-tetrahydrodipicolinate synthase [Gammaproteobacteria bacterium]MBU1655500.1 4-hydroxy-tetrahydrodipicolinate synthase [Gammaproteobacteria bacterium]MBU1960825.1 4-hydroxy-tetrahydrodipicolinate synthase [Gammaproteobacteria bacterium]
MIQGSLVALVTPMAENGAVDFECLRRLVEWHVQEGTDAIVSVGTTGESSTLDEQEHCEVIRRTIEYVAGRIPVIAGTGANSTAEAIHLTRQAKEMGADACLLVTPYYNKPTQEGLYLHFKAVAEAVDIPQILYNVPGRTACDMKPETAGRLAELTNIVGIKEATGDLERVAALRGLCGEGFALYSGDDATAREFILLGGNGVISVTANLVPARMHRMCRAALDGDRDAAQAFDNGIASLHEKLFVESNPIPVKWALAQMGRIPAGIRLPLTPLSESARPLVHNAMALAGLI